MIEAGLPERRRRDGRWTAVGQPGPIVQFLGRAVRAVGAFFRAVGAFYRVVEALLRWV